jgi:hypothetical protein
MRDRFSGPLLALAMAAAAGAVIPAAVTEIAAQAPAASGAALKTPWGEPDLQGIWTDEFDTPLQRPAKYANQEFFTPAQREEIDRERGVHSAATRARSAAARSTSAAPTTRCS